MKIHHERVMGSLVKVNTLSNWQKENRLIQEEVVHLRREIDSLKKLLENEKKQTQNIKKRIIDQRAFYSKLLNWFNSVLESFADVGSKNLISCRDTLVCLRLDADFLT